MADASQIFYKGEIRNCPASVTFNINVTLTSATLTLYDAAGNIVAGYNNVSATLTVPGPALTVTVGKVIDTTSSAISPGEYRAYYSLFDTNGLIDMVEVVVFVKAVP